ncbi:MAG: DNA-binding protein [Dehalococcoidia bacterium]|nr:DNA-binding protein [Dehalococcoidia bacterium]
MFKKIHVFRVKPGQELLDSISRYCQENGVLSGVIIGIIGSLENAKLNFLKSLPGKYDSVDYNGPLEIVCAQGTIALKDDTIIIHIHIQLSGQDICSGGHLAGATIFSTAEVTVGELDYQLRREIDSYTGLNELVD